MIGIIFLLWKQFSSVHSHNFMSKNSAGANVYYLLQSIISKSLLFLIRIQIMHKTQYRSIHKWIKTNINKLLLSGNANELNFDPFELKVLSISGYVPSVAEVASLSWLWPLENAEWSSGRPLVHKNGKCDYALKGCTKLIKLMENLHYEAIRPDAIVAGIYIFTMSIIAHLEQLLATWHCPGSLRRHTRQYSSYMHIPALPSCFFFYAELFSALPNISLQCLSGFSALLCTTGHRRKMLGIAEKPLGIA